MAPRRNPKVLLGLALVLVLGGVWRVAIGASDSSRTVKITVPGAEALPPFAPRIQAADGTEYTRVATGYLDTTKENAVTVSVPAGKTGLTVYTTCRLGAPAAHGLSAVGLDTASGNGLAAVFECSSGPRSADLNRSDLVADGTRLTFTRTGTLADAPADAPAAWGFAVYAWSPAPNPGPVAAAPVLPATIADPGGSGRSLRAGQVYRGTWPDDDSVTLTLTHTSIGEVAEIAIACNSALAGQRIQIDLPAVAELGASEVECAAPGKPLTNSLLPVKFGPNSPASITLTIPLGFDPTLRSRHGAWVVAVYRP